MRILKFIDQRLVAIFIASLIFVIFFAFENSPRKNIWSDAEILILNLSYSFISAFIFYLFIDVTKRLQDAISLKPLISKELSRMKGDVMAVCAEAARIQGLPPEQAFKLDLTKESSENLIKGVTWYSHANMIFPDGTKATFLEYMLDRAERTNLSLERLLELKSFWNAEGIKLITEVQNGSYLNQLKYLKELRNQLRNEGVVLGSALDTHYRAIMQLEKCAEKTIY